MKNRKTAIRISYSLISCIFIGLLLAALGGEKLAIIGAVICLGSMATLIALTNLYGGK